jgi:hypothetical protein
MSNNYKDLAKYIRDMARVLVVLSEEIKQDKKLTRESKDLLSKIGSDLLYKACAYTYVSKDK